MRKVALVFVIAVILPSLLLGVLAVRSLRDQQFILERQQSLLYQGLADAKAGEIQNILSGQQRTFTQVVDAVLLQNAAPKGKAAQPAKSADGAASSHDLPNFDQSLRRVWPLAHIGFVISSEGEILSPAAQGSPEARKFVMDNGRFLANRETAQVYWNPKQGINSAVVADQQISQATPLNNAAQMPLANNFGQFRNVLPQQADGSAQNAQRQQMEPQSSRLSFTQAEFGQLIGDATDGALARFVDNKLSVLFWCRPSQNPQLVCGAELSIPQLVQALRGPVEDIAGSVKQEICVALLDDNAKPVLSSAPAFRANWKRPFVATEIGEVLPHWELAVYMLNPEALSRTATTIRLTLGILIAVLLLAIGVGSWLIVADLNRQLALAREKTTFVSNVSHELKTPLTSIRMFSELLLEGRVADAQKQRKYLGIITAETARLTRLINNVLDFARMERGEKKYRFQDSDLRQIVSDTVNAYRPHLEAAGFKFDCELPASSVAVRADCDAISQVLLNLLSNAEKYSGERKEIRLEVQLHPDPVSHAEVRICDRGLGVPRGCEEKIFEKFYRAHDALNSGIQGSGLGLTLARQIARAHGGEVLYKPRQGGGSIFSLSLPVSLKTGPPSRPLIESASTS